MRAEDLRREELIGKNIKDGLPLIGSHRIMLAGLSSMARLGEDLVQIVGQKTMALIMARFGYEAGMGQAMSIAELYNFDSAEEWLKAGTALRTMIGVAHETINNVELDLEKKRLRFSGTWENSLEMLTCNSLNMKLDFGPVCFIMTGMASGYASAVLGSEVLVKEIECQAQGHNVCVYEGRSANEWGMDPKDIRDYFALKTFDEEINRLREKLKQSKEDLERQNEEIQHLKREARRTEADHGIIIRSKPMVQLMVLAKRVAQSNATVLIQGESGTGKEVIARYIHRHSARKEEPFLGISCAALPPNLLESELFGHVKGAFTGADSDKTGLLIEAGKGTFFLDEIGELPLDLQAKLLRAFQEREVRPVGGIKNVPVHARILAATNQDLKDMVAQGLFRKDLYYRLAVFPLLVIPLRQRKEDILLLARHFLNRLQKNHPGFSPEALKKMEAHPWPGNVRELENCVEYAFVLAGDKRIMPEHLPFSLAHSSQDLLSNLALDMPTLKDLEHRYIDLVLDHTNNLKTEAARVLGVSTNTLWRRMKEKQ